MVGAEGWDFTCLLPVCPGDDATHLDQALGSIARNTHPAKELVICQDGALPPDLDRVVSRRLCEPGARRVVNTGPRGLQHNLNRAAASLTTPWFCRADADDVNLPHRFESQIRFLRAHPEVDVLGAGIVEFWPDGRARAKPTPIGRGAITRWAAYRNPINHMTAFVRVEAFRACGGYPDIPLKEDYGLWLTMLARGYRFANLDETLVRARLGEDFHRRRSGWRHLASEWALFRLKREISAIGPGRAALALAARAGVLATGLTARLAYQTVLRR